MFARFFSWPRIFAVLVAGLGVSGLVDSSRFFPNSWQFVQFSQLLQVAACLFFLFLSYFLFRGRDWARRVLLVVAILFGGWRIIPRAISIFGPHTFSGMPVQPWMVREAVLGAIGDFILGITLVAFFILLFCHRDVVAAFQRRW
jgi:hypothetical protein